MPSIRDSISLILTSPHLRAGLFSDVATRLAAFLFSCVVPSLREPTFAQKKHGTGTTNRVKKKQVLRFAQDDKKWKIAEAELQGSDHHNVRFPRLAPKGRTRTWGTNLVQRAPFQAGE